MKMMRIAMFVVLAVMMMPFRSWGQDTEVRRDMPADNGGGEPKNEISASVGIPSGFGTVFDLFKVIIEGTVNAIGGHQNTETNFIGTYGLDYHYQVNSWFRPGLKLVYEGLSTKVTDTNNLLVKQYYTTTLSIMPGVQFSYLNRKHVKLYSAVELGVTFLFDNNKPAYSTTLFAVNVTPFGLRAGNEKIFGMMETNLGMDALIKAGVGVRF